MRLYTPLSADEAAQAVQGEGLPGRTLFWVDRPLPEEAQEDSVWVAIEVSEEEVAEFEEPFEPALSYREFELPSKFAARHPISRVSVP